MENNILTILADNPALLEALKKTILNEFSLDEGYNFRSDVSNDTIGQITRAILSGRQRVERAFVEIKKHKTIPDKPESVNPAR